MAELDTVVAVQGIANVNFFNDRVLTAEDLRQLSEADHQHRRSLGRAIGEGVAVGMEVTAAGGRSVVVGDGLAVSAIGDAIRLPVPVTVDLGSAGAVAPGPGPGLFTECSTTTSDPLDIGGAVYLLTVQPASQQVGEAPRADLDGVARSCGPRHDVDGVRFRRVFVDLGRLVDEAGLATGPLGLTDPGQANTLRSLVAHLYLGTPWLGQGAVDGFGSGPLRRAWDVTDLEPCEVPLAIIAMTGATLAFVEAWGVRRPPMRAGADPFEETGPGWQRLVDQATAATGLAALAQFQHQLDELEALPGLTPRATEHFRYLPGAGLLQDPRPFTGLAEIPFLDGLPVRSDLTVELDQVQEVLRRGAEIAPIDTSFPQTTVHVATVLGSDPPTVLFVGGGHPLARDAELIDLRQAVTDLRIRVASLESDTESPPGVTVTAIDDTTEVEVDRWVEIRFRVDVKTAGRYRASKPLLQVKSGTRPPVDLELRGSDLIETDDRASRVVSVRLRWRTKTTSPFDLVGERDTDRPVFGSTAGGPGSVLSESGALRFGDKIELGQQGTLLGAVRLTVERVDDEAVSDTGSATVVFRR